MAKTEKIDFIKVFYRVFAVFGAAGLIAGFAFGGSGAALSYGLGWFSIGLIVFLWDVTLAYVVGPRKTHWAWESLLAMLRYVLLGGLFYAMISLFAVQWPWYIGGTATLLPGLLVSAAIYRGEA